MHRFRSLQPTICVTRWLARYFATNGQMPLFLMLLLFLAVEKHLVYPSLPFF